MLIDERTLPVGLDWGGRVTCDNHHSCLDHVDVSRHVSITHSWGGGMIQCYVVNFGDGFPVLGYSGPDGEISMLGPSVLQRIAVQEDDVWWLWKPLETADGQLLSPYLTVSLAEITKSVSRYFTSEIWLELARAEFRVADERIRSIGRIQEQVHRILDESSSAGDHDRHVVDAVASVTGWTPDQVRLALRSWLEGWDWLKIVDMVEAVFDED